MHKRLVKTIAIMLFTWLVPSFGRAQSDDVQSMSIDIELELAVLQGNLEVTVGPTVEQMRTRLRAARDHISRFDALLAAEGTEVRALHELDAVDREILLLQGMLEGSYLNGREFMLGHIRTVQVYSTRLRALLGVGAPPPVGRPVIQHPPSTEIPLEEPQPVGPTAMEHADFMNLLAGVNSQAFSDGKLAVIRQAVSAGNYFTAAQVSQLVGLMDFGDDKIEVVLTTYPNIVDPQNLYTIYSQFDFESDIQELQRQLGLQ